MKKFSIGNTPIRKLKSGVFLKMEFLNCGGSIKSRVALKMIELAIRDKRLNKDSKHTILEASGGNTAFALAMISNYYDWNLVLVIPDNYSKKKVFELESMGAKVILSDHTTGNDSHVVLAKKLYQENKEWIYLDQLSNMGNIIAHYDGTGREIENELQRVDAFVAGIGSGGTITGAGKKLKESFDDMKIYGVLPKDYSIENNIFIHHSIQGIGIGIIPEVFDTEIVDEYIFIYGRNQKKSKRNY